jgi:hypothetical protein
MLTLGHLKQLSLTKQEIALHTNTSLFSSKLKSSSRDLPQIIPGNGKANLPGNPGKTGTGKPGKETLIASGH